MATIGNVGEDVNGLGGLALLYYPLAVLYQPSHDTLWFSKEIENVLQARELGSSAHNANHGYAAGWRFKSGSIQRLGHQYLEWERLPCVTTCLTG